jgi:OmcA/MtrC family decaheme c-type cytochrome
MRTPLSPGFIKRTSLVLGLLVGSIALVSAPKPVFTVHDKAYYASAEIVAFVRPGLQLKILSGNIASDGTITTRFRITDPKGLPLDKDGVYTPGAVSINFLAAVLPRGQPQYTPYTADVETSSITGNSVVNGNPDEAGTLQKVADGEYVYEFGKKAPTGFDASATHTIGAFASRDLTDFDLGTNYTDATFTFVPNGSAVVNVHDVVKTASCNACHDPLSFHKGTRRSVELCVLCHTAQAADPDTGLSLDFKVMVHKIHQGADLPSVKAGGTYTFIAADGTVYDYSSIVFPADTRNCVKCHDPNAGAKQANNYLTKPNRAACGSCHDNVNFATGENHVDLPEPDDNQCASCHIPQSELEFDASIIGAHTIPQRSQTLPGVVVNLLKVDRGAAGQHPTVTFTLKDKAGNAIALSDMNRLALVLAGPTLDYGAANFGVSTPGYVSEDATKASCGSDGTCTYTFKTVIPANARGTFTLGVEARRVATLLPGTKKETTVEYGAVNKVLSFSVDGSPVFPRRAVVSIERCNQCHSFLSVHGENRNQIEMCVLCHNPNETDKARRPASATPPQAVNFAQMIHKIHTGEDLRDENPNYQFTIYGFGGSKNDFTDVHFPGDRRDCATCHVNGSEQLPLQDGLQQVADPRGLINPVGPITSACTGCHTAVHAASHALANATQLGESCEVCHEQDAAFSINKVHSR